MNISAVLVRKAANAARHRTRMTRRQFARSAAGSAVLGGALGSGLFKPGLARTRASFAPVPIRGGTPLLGGSFHVFAPAPTGADPIDTEPITITNFNGFVGL